MEFLAPAGLGLLGLMAPVLLFYMLKLRREHRRISSTLLWKRVCEDVHANAFWQRLRRQMLLLIQLLVIVLLAIAFARPYYLEGRVRARDLILVIDNSDSMRARDQERGGTRLATAIARAIDEADGAGPSRRVTIVATAPRARVLVSHSEKESEIQAALESIRPLGAGAAEDALALARRLSSAGRTHTLYFSDGGGDTRPLRGMGRGVEWIRCGASAPNWAVTRFAIVPNEESLDAFVQVRSTSGSSSNITLTIDRDGEIIEARHLSIEPYGRSSVFFELPHAIDGRYTASIETDDAMREDDRAHFALNRSRNPRIAVSATEQARSVLIAALRIMPEIELHDLGRSDPGQFDLVFWEKDGPPPSVGGLHCVFAPLPGPWGADSLTEAPEVVSWSATTGPFRGTNLNRLLLRKAVRLDASALSEVHIRGSQGPLAGLWENVSGRRLLVGFSLDNSDLPLRLAFPLFLRNVVRDALDRRVNLAPGEAIEGTITGKARMILTDPRGAEFDLGPAGFFRHEGTDAPGFYRLRNGLEEQHFAVNIDGSEADLTVPELSALPVESVSVEESLPRDIFPWFLTLAIFALAIEWWVYHRRLFT